ncbi:unnamed protein product [Staurois parvus]|uniref:Sulfotransferase n=1 Tax=Staurois parvus TaxID=386267 RepID=A0ABN9DU15_9NEOB|nr:unnamed protein product [Staurois parvus]
MIFMDGDAERCRRASTYDRHPFIEVVAPKPVPSGLQLAKSMKPPRILKTHLPVQLLPPSFWDQDCKVIYIARNAKDSMVSYFHFQRMNKGLSDPGNWEAYFSKFLSGNVPWGSWFDNVLGWWNAKNHHQVLYIFYEDMIEDPRREICKVMRFLEKDLSEEVLGEDISAHNLPGYEGESNGQLQHHPIICHGSVHLALHEKRYSGGLEEPFHRLSRYNIRRGIPEEDGRERLDFPHAALKSIAFRSAHQNAFCSCLLFFR